MPGMFAAWQRLEVLTQLQESERSASALRVAKMAMAAEFDLTSEICGCNAQQRAMTAPALGESALELAPAGFRLKHLAQAYERQRKLLVAQLRSGAAIPISP